MKGDMNRLPQQDGEELGLAQLLDEYLPRSGLQRGQTVRGTVVRASSDSIVVDVGAKCEGIVRGQEMERLDPEVVAQLQPGDKVPVYVIDPDGPSGEVVLSLVRAQLEMDWQQAESLQESKEVVELEVVSSNRGGLIVQLDRLRGFIPASQLAPSRCVPRISDPSCREILDELVGKSLWVQVIEVDQDRNRLILSERAAEAKMKKRERIQFLDALEEGAVCEGRVSNLTDFGAFVNMGTIDGLVHLSEISWERVDHPREVLEVGQEVEVLVLNVDEERQRVALSLKRLQPDPWETLEDRYEVGQLVDCSITRLTKWGAFACIVDDPAIEGLVHISELCDEHVEHPQDVVRPGQEVTLRVVRMEPERHRLALSLRRVDDEEEVELEGSNETLT